MKPKRLPLILHIWMIGTFCFSYPIAILSKYLHRRMGADPKRFPERLGRNGSHRKEEVIWFHAASLGEVKQIGPLAEYLHKATQIKILVTTTTATGADWVAQEMPNALHRFAPIDTPFSVRRFLSGWSMAAAIFVEGDLWPRLVLETQKKGVPQILLNARHSRTRARLPAVFGSLLSPFSLITCRSERIADDVRSLGLAEDQVRVLPDLRLTLPSLNANSALIKSLSDTIGTRPIWLAASTHPADEEAVLAAHLEVLRSFPEALLIMAPRHTSRGEPVHKFARDKGLTVAQRSINEEILENTQIYIADTLGELGAFYTLAPIAFLGGSFGSEGGHNPYEPAGFQTAILYGPHVKNFIDAYADLTNVGAALQVEEPTKLGETLIGLMRTDDTDAMAHAGLMFINEQQESVSNYGELITKILRPSQG